MGEVITIGLDIAKSVFQIHGVDGDGAVVIRKRVSRGKVLEFFADLSPCLVGIEACPTAHHWSRELQSLGHTVKLMSPSYVKAYPPPTASLIYVDEFCAETTTSSIASRIISAITNPIRHIAIRKRCVLTGILPASTTSFSTFLYFPARSTRWSLVVQFGSHFVNTVYDSSGINNKKT
jgi:hypothetical protein